MYRGALNIMFQLVSIKIFPCCSHVIHTHLDQLVCLPSMYTEPLVSPPVHLAGRITNPEAYELEGRVFESQSLRLRSIFRSPGVK